MMLHQYHPIQTELRTRKARNKRDTRGKYKCLSEHCFTYLFSVISVMCMSHWTFTFLLYIHERQILKRQQIDDREMLFIDFLSLDVLIMSCAFLGSRVRLCTYSEYREMVTADVGQGLVNRSGRVLLSR
jgi:hypothetical protein